MRAANPFIHAPRLLLGFIAALPLVAAPNVALGQTATGSKSDALVALGQALFFDARLSNPPGQACATCHDPSRAFSDPRQEGAGGALSLGADGRSLGDRNAPTLTYLFHVPSFHRAGSQYVGGFFLDGRAATLAAQALEPLLNPLEMALPDENALTERILAVPDYRQALTALFGERALDDGRATIQAVAAAIASFERSSTFSSFDSRFDRHLAGTYAMTRDEAIGEALFFSDLVNCSQCHLNELGRLSPRETFTDHTYHNIGVPANRSARQANGLGASHRDLGLGGREDLPDAAQQAGRFRVPSLRNVAVTAPYMHNGVFRTLEGAVAFYGKYTLTNRPAQINPETGAPWAPPEVGENIEHGMLRAGQPLDAQRVQHLVAFLKTLTDARYEHLLR